MTVGNQQSSRYDLGMESYSLRNMYLSVFVVQMVYTYIAMMLAWTSFMIPYLETFLHISTADRVAILGSLPLGMMLGPVIGSVLAPRYGYKSIFLQFGCLSLASVPLLTFRHVLVICIARLGGGIAIGAVLCYAEAYTHDISDPEVRALLKPLSMVFLSLGFYLVYDVGQILLYFEMLLILLVVPVLFLASLTWLPESPYVLVASGNLEKAKKSVDFLHRGISTRGLEQLILLTQEDVRKREEHIFLLPFNKDPRAARTTLVLSVLLPLTGFPVVFMLLEPLISEAQQQVAVGSSLSAVARVNLCPIPVAWLLNTLCSPRIKMAVSSAVMSLSMMAFGFFFYYLDTGQNVSDVYWLPLIFFMLYTTAFLVGFAHKPEEVTNRPRECGRVVSLTAGFFCMLLIVVLFPLIKDIVGTASMMWSFSIFSIVMTIFISIFIPDSTLF